MKVAAALILMLSINSAMGQKIPELIRQADTTSSDSLRVLLYARTAMEYRRMDPDSASFFARKALELSNSIEVPEAQASAHNVIGTLLFFQSAYDSALHHFGACYDISVAIKDSLRLGSMLNNIGQVNTYQSNYDTAIYLLLQSRAMYAKVDSSRVTSPVNNIGNAYYKMQDFDRALNYYKEAAELKKKYGQRLSLSNSLNNIGIILKNQGKYEEAIPYYKESLEIAEEFNDRNKQANAHNNLGALYQDGPKDYKKSEYHFLQAIAIKEQMGDRAGLFNSYNNYADLLAELERFSEALANIEKADRLERQLGTTMYTVDGLLFKSFVLRDLGRYKEAYETYQKAYIEKIDQVNEDRNNKIAEWETKFESARKEAEIQRLELETNLQKAEIENTRLFVLLFTIGSVLTISVLVVFFTLRSKKQKAENEAQELQLEAMKNRLIELNISVTEISLNLEDLNKQLHAELTEREFEVLQLSMQGKTNAEISDQLFISKSTVKFHLRNTYGKLGVNNRKEALAYVANS